MIYLDTHVVLWLFAGLLDRFNEKVKRLINKNDLYVSPAVGLELQYLFEIERITRDANAILSDLYKRVGLRICQREFYEVINCSIKLFLDARPF